MIRLFFVAALTLWLPAGLAAQNPPDPKKEQKPEVRKDEKAPKQEPGKDEKPGKDDKAAKDDKAGKENKEGEEPASEGEPEMADFRRRMEKFRLRLFLGVGYQKFKPAILSEAGPAWQLNNFIRAANGVSQPAILIGDAGSIPAVPLRWGLDFTWRDRITASFERHFITQSYSQKYPAKVTFLAPGNASYQNAIYEGLRVLKWIERRDELEVMYLHPLPKGIKAGGFIARQEYVENIEVSMGSLTATRAGTNDGGILTWSQGGSVPATFRTSGWLLGPAVRYQLFEWLGFTYKLAPFQRKGNFDMAGLQILSAQTYTTAGAPGAIAYQALAPFHFGSFKDKGMRHTLETALRLYCRYSVHLGIVKEDFSRSYDSYFGYTFSPTINFHPKTNGLGIGEMSQSFNSSTLAMYLKFGLHFYF